MTRAGGASAWNKPTIVIAILSFVANCGWAFVGITRQDNQNVESRLRAVEIGLAEVRIEVKGLAESMRNGRGQ